MKRFLAFTISVAVLVSVMSVFAGCDNDSSSKSTSAATTTTALTTTTMQNVTSTTQEITSNDRTLHTTAVVDKTTTDNTTTTTGKKTTTTTTKNSTTSTTANSTTTSKYMQVIVGDSAWEQVMLYQTIELSSSYELVCDWLVDGNYIHMITYNYNRYLVMDMDTGKLVRKVALPDMPKTIQLVGDELWIGFEELKTIKIYDLGTGEFKRDMVFENYVSKFIVYGDYLFYSQAKSLPRQVYQYNLKTGVTSTKWFDVGGTRHNFAINPGENLIYVCGSGSTGCYLYALDINTLATVAKYPTMVANSGGVYYSNGAVYWAGKKLNAKTLEVELEYQRIDSSSSWLSTSCAAYGFVITGGGLYRHNNPIRLCKSPGGSAEFLKDGRIVSFRSYIDSKGVQHNEFNIGFNIFA